MKKNKPLKDGCEGPERSLNVGAAVRRLREERQLSGAALCRRGQGIDPKTLTALEKGRIKNPSIATLQALARGLEMTVGDLFRQMELQQQDLFSLGTQKGFCKIDFFPPGVQLVSFTPLNGALFCGKIIVEGQKGFDDRLFASTGVLFVMLLIGQVEGQVEGRKMTFKEGDNLFLNGGMKFRLSNPRQRPATLWLVTAPSCLQGRRGSASAIMRL